MQIAVPQERPIRIFCEKFVSREGETNSHGSPVGSTGGELSRGAQFVNPSPSLFSFSAWNFDCEQVHIEPCAFAAVIMGERRAKAGEENKREAKPSAHCPRRGNWQLLQSARLSRNKPRF